MRSQVNMAVPSPVPFTDSLCLFPAVFARRNPQGERTALTLFRDVAAFSGIIREENGIRLLCSEELRAIELLRNPMANDENNPVILPAPIGKTLPYEKLIF